MNIERHFIKRLVLYVIPQCDQDFDILKRELASVRRSDLFTSEGLKLYAENHFKKQAKASKSAVADYNNLMVWANYYPGAVFILRWTRCKNFYALSRTHYVYMRRRVADYECQTIRRVPYQKREADER